MGRFLKMMRRNWKMLLKRLSSGLRRSRNLWKVLPCLFYRLWVVEQVVCQVVCLEVCPVECLEECLEVCLEHLEAALHLLQILTVVPQLRKLTRFVDSFHNNCYNNIYI